MSSAKINVTNATGVTTLVANVPQQPAEEIAGATPTGKVGVWVEVCSAPGSDAAVAAPLTKEEIEAKLAAGRAMVAELAVQKRAAEQAQKAQKRAAERSPEVQEIHATHQRTCDNADLGCANRAAGFLTEHEQEMFDGATVNHTHHHQARAHLERLRQTDTERLTEAQAAEKAHANSDAFVKANSLCIEKAAAVLAAEAALRAAKAALEDAEAAPEFATQRDLSVDTHLCQESVDYDNEELNDVHRDILEVEDTIAYCKGEHCGTAKATAKNNRDSALRALRKHRKLSGEPNVPRAPMEPKAQKKVTVITVDNATKTVTDAVKNVATKSSGHVVCPLFIDNLVEAVQEKSWTRSDGKFFTVNGEGTRTSKGLTSIEFILDLAINCGLDEDNEMSSLIALDEAKTAARKAKNSPK